MNDFPSMNINIEELRVEVERLIGIAREEKSDLGAVNWNYLRVVDIEYRMSMLRQKDGQFCVVMIEEADAGSWLASWLYERLDKEKFPRVYIECEW